MTPVEVARTVAADPSSVALVLAGPAARELWPQRTRRLVDVVDSRRSELVVDVEPPRRTGVGFSTAVVVRGDDGVVAGGRLTITPAVDAGCTVQLALTAADEVAGAVQRDARAYVDNLAAISRARSSVA